MHTYSLKHGDSLRSVAEKFGAETQKLRTLNGIREEDGLFVGQRLNIPIRMIRRTRRRGETYDSIAVSLQIPKERLMPLDDNTVLALF